MPAEKLYLRNTTANIGSYGTASLSVNNVASASTVGNFDLDLALDPAAGDNTNVVNTLANTSAQKWFHGRWFSPVLQCEQIEAQNWTIADNPNENNANANAFLMGVWYVVTPADTVRGFIYDGTALLNIEYGTADEGRVSTVAGSRVTGIAPGQDRLCYEVWDGTAAQGNAISRAIRRRYDGNTEPTQGVSRGTNPVASYILSTNTDLFTAKTPRKAPFNLAKFAQQQQAIR